MFIHEGASHADQVRERNWGQTMESFVWEATAFQLHPEIRGCFLKGLYAAVWLDVL